MIVGKGFTNSNSQMKSWLFFVTVFMIWFSQTPRLLTKSCKKSDSWPKFGGVLESDEIDIKFWISVLFLKFQKKNSFAKYCAIFLYLILETSWNMSTAVNFKLSLLWMMSFTSESYFFDSYSSFDSIHWSVSGLNTNIELFS